MKTYIKIISAICFMTAFISCTLGVQEDFDFQGETYITDDPYKNMTAWEFIQSRVSPREANGTMKLVSNTTGLGINGDELDLFVSAIKKVGFEEYYNQTMTTSRTYLMLNNNAFSGNTAQSVVFACRGTQLADNATINPDTYFDNWTPTELNVLKAILKQHMMSEYIAQRPTIPTFSVHVVFNTLLPKVDLASGSPVLSNEMSEIAFFRNPDSRTTLVINETTAPLPVTAVSPGWPENVRRHHFVFNNGIGHFLNELIRYQPYDLYTNLPIN